MLVVKTGMQAEFDIAQKYAAKDVVVLTGTQTVNTLASITDCEAIISFGLCGGLAPTAAVGKAYIYSHVNTMTGPNWADFRWRKRLFAKTHYTERGCWSTGQFNTANNEEQRAKLYAQTSCDIIDDESNIVAEFARQKKLPFLGLRVVSDGAQDNLPPAVVDAIKPDGTTDLIAVIKSVIEDPLQIPSLVKTAQEYQQALVNLQYAARLAGPYFGWK